MSNERKQLLIISIILIGLILYQIVQMICFIPTLQGIQRLSAFPAERSLLLLLNIFLFLLTCFAVLVQSILAVKGLLEAREPSSTRFHIVLATIAGIFFVLDLLNKISEMFSEAQPLSFLFETLFAIVYVAVIGLYNVKSRQVRLKA